MFDVITLGEILIDFTDVGFNDQQNRLFAQNPGGAVANVAVSVQKLGGNAAFIGKVGKDMHGDFLIDTLKKENVDTSHLLQDENSFTTLAFVMLDDSGERYFSFARKPGADTQIRAEEIEEDFIKQGKILDVGSLSLTDEPAKSATLHALKTANENGVIVAYDPNYRASLWNSEEEAIKEMRSLIPYADIMKISDEETALLTGHEDPKEAARALLDQGVDIVCVTLGAEGTLVASQEGMAIVPGFKSTVVDTTGAGDSFWAGMLYNIAKLDKKVEDISLDELKKAARFANAAAALTIQKLGAIPALPSYEQVIELMESKPE